MMTEQLLQRLREHEGKWVALFQRTDETVIAAVGEDAADASEKAAQKGYADTTLFKVHPGDRVYVPLA